MELKQVRYALAVHTCGNFTRAAVHSKVTQPTLTQAIGRLEEELGAPLFVRDRAGSQPTALGAKLLPIFEESGCKGGSRRPIGRGACQAATGADPLWSGGFARVSLPVRGVGHV